jgi:integrase
MRNKYDAPHVLFRDGIYYYVRRIPHDLTTFYSVKRLCFSLKTKSCVSAKRLSTSVTQRLDDYWLGLRLQNMDIPAIQLVKTDDKIAEDATPLLSDALELYLRLKAVGKDKVFVRTANRNVGYVIKVLGDKPIRQYSSSEAATFRDWLIKQSMSMRTVKRVFASVRAVVNLTISEHGLDCINGFAKTYFPTGEDINDRLAIPNENIKKVQALCVEMDDDMRWLIALISDTGMRLGEAAGLHMDDIKLDEPIPYIDLKPHPWRSLKTRCSQRRIPLVGAALWACRRLREVNESNSLAFPRYCNKQSCNANSASGGLNKWLQTHVPAGCVIHSFRHSLRDRLRAVECPSDIVDAIGGWKTAGVGHGYGDGYPLDVLMRWISEIEFIH